MVFMPSSAQAKIKGKSYTKTVAGVMFKLTQPKVLKMGKAVLELSILNPKTGKHIPDASFGAEFYMKSDGMKTPIKATKNKDGSFKLETKFTMKGEWTLRFKSIKPKINKKKLEPFNVKVK